MTAWSAELDGDLVYVDGHSALADDADWNAPVWSFTEEGRTSLIKTLDLICGHVHGEFSIEAAWDGDRTLEVLQISRDGLRRLIADNRLGNRVRYVVNP